MRPEGHVGLKRVPLGWLCRAGETKLAALLLLLGQRSTHRNSKWTGSWEKGKRPLFFLKSPSFPLGSYWQSPTGRSWQSGNEFCRDPTSYHRLRCDRVKVKALSPVRLFVTPWTIQSLEFPRPEYWSGSLSLLQGIFPTQGSNPRLPHCRWILYQLTHKGSSWKEMWS